METQLFSDSNETLCTQFFVKISFLKYEFKMDFNST